MTSGFQRTQLVIRHLRATPKAKLVLIAIADHTGDDASAFPSQRRLGALTGLSERSVRDALEELEKLGVLSVELRKAPSGHGRHSLYTVLDETLAALPHVAGDECTCVDATGNPCRSPATGKSCRSSEGGEEPDRQKSSALTGRNRQQKRTSEERTRARVARDVTEELRVAIKAFGRTHGSDARQGLSTPALSVVDVVGWSTLCGSRSDQLGLLVADALARKAA